MDRNGKTRITLDLKRSLFKRLERLEEMLDADSKAAVLREAISWFDYVANNVKAGSRFQIVKPDGETETIVFFPANLD